jgi:hypothetical protein
VMILLGIYRVVIGRREEPKAPASPTA